MQLENMKKQMLRQLNAEKNRLTAELEKVSNVISALIGKVTHRGPGPRKGRKLSEAHKARIRAGIKRAKAERLAKEKNKAK